MGMFFLDKLSLSIGIDLGTSNTLAGVPGKGIIFDEPTIVARQRKTTNRASTKIGGRMGPVLAFGKKAKQMVGREPRQIEVIEPIVNGAIADFDAVVEFLKYLLSVVGELPSSIPRLLKSKAVIGVPSGITEVEKRAVKSAAFDAGMGKVFLVEKPILVAVGVGLTIERAAGNLIVDIGGGTTEIAAISLGGIVLHRCLKFAGCEMDESIVNFIRMKYGILIGLPTAEKIKIEIGSVLPKNTGQKKKAIVRGRDLETGLPKTVEVKEDEIREAISPTITKIISNLNELLEEMPPELTADIARRGVVLSGGLVQLSGMEELINSAIKMPVWTAKNPNNTVVLGCIKLLENEKMLKKVMVTGGVK